MSIVPASPANDQPAAQDGGSCHAEKPQRAVGTPRALLAFLAGAATAGLAVAGLFHFAPATGTSGEKAAVALTAAATASTLEGAGLAESDENTGAATRLAAEAELPAAPVTASVAAASQAEPPATVRVIPIPRQEPSTGRPQSWLPPEMQRSREPVLTQSDDGAPGAQPAAAAADDGRHAETEAAAERATERSVPRVRRHAGPRQARHGARRNVAGQSPGPLRSATSHPSGAPIYDGEGRIIGRMPM